MVKELDVSCVSGFANRIKTAMVDNASKSGLTLGFEWEIPMDDYDYRFNGDEVLGQDWLHSRGFYGYYDSGGREVCSPIFNNVSTCRRFAKFLMESAEEAYNVYPGEHGGRCGIHVHVCDPTDKPVELRDRHFEWGKLHHSPAVSWFYNNLNSSESVGVSKFRIRHRIMSGVLNKLTDNSQDFLWDFTMRNRDGGGYNNQARQTESGDNPGMLKMNRHGNSVTSEFRLWSSHKSRLLPAVEFSHAMFKFGQHLLDQESLSGWLDKLCHISGGQYTHMSKPFTDLPGLDGFFNWLDGQRGYRILKSDPAVVEHFG